VFSYPPWGGVTGGRTWDYHKYLVVFAGPESSALLGSARILTLVTVTNWFDALRRSASGKR
jgi:hypothetical protein